MEKWLILRLGKEIYKMSLEHLIVPESKEVLQPLQPQSHIDEDMSEEHRSQLKEFPVAQTENSLSSRIDKAALDYNP